MVVYSGSDRLGRRCFTADASCAGQYGVFKSDRGIVCGIMLVNGLILIFFGRYAKGSDDRSRSWGSFFIGLLYVLGGVLLMMNPSLTAVTLLYVFMFWAFFVGCSLIWAAFELKRLGD